MASGNQKGAPMPRSTLPSPPLGLHHYWLRRDWGWLHLSAGGQGPALWLVHGLGGSGQDFYDLAPLLSQEFTLLIPDLPGAGFSDKPDLDYSPVWLAHELARVSAGLGLERAFWLGHSMGGQIVLTLGLEHPEMARALVGVCPSGGHVGIKWWHHMLFALLVRPGDHLRLYHRSIIRLWVRMIYGDPSHPSRQELTRRVQEQWDSLEGPLVERSFVRGGRALAGRSVVATSGRPPGPGAAGGGQKGPRHPSPPFGPPAGPSAPWHPVHGAALRPHAPLHQAPGAGPAGERLSAGPRLAMPPPASRGLVLRLRSLGDERPAGGPVHPPPGPPHRGGQGRQALQAALLWGAVGRPSAGNGAGPHQEPGPLAPGERPGAGRPRGPARGLHPSHGRGSGAGAAAQGHPVAGPPARGAGAGPGHPGPPGTGQPARASWARPW